MNNKQKKILYIIYLLISFITELRKPFYNPVGFFNFKSKDITIYKKQATALIHLSANDSKGVELLHFRVGSDRRFLIIILKFKVSAYHYRHGNYLWFIETEWSLS
uniref:hypothetical protein n=1 Tax=Phylloporia weberiana TaxID=1001332 RepID=UPI002E7811C4|nr:hypothetical protein V2880_mgp34 [Ganoderma weberianum]WQH62849.1 hypothetical protein [Ganoderma weberianum]